MACHFKRTTVIVAASPPYSITDAEIAALGYVVVTLPPYSAQGDGVTDDTAALQAAIDDAYEDNKPVWIPWGATGVYLVNDTLRCYAWGPKQTGNNNTNQHILVGATVPGRPTIKIISSSTKFDSTPRPVVGFAKWKPTIGGSVAQAVPSDSITPSVGTDAPANRNDIPSSPYTAPHSDWGQATSVLFSNGFVNIDIDTSEKANADGLCFATAQGCYLANVRVIATNSHTGIQGLPGRSSVAMNIEVEGGQIGVSTKANYGSIGSTAGCMVAGLRLFNQTSRNLEVGDFVPLTVVGFHFTKASGGSSWVVENSGSQTSVNGATLIDGIIETSSGTVIDNTQSQPLYIRRVYITGGATNLVKNGGSATITGSGTWKLINEISSNTMDGTFIAPDTPETGSSDLQHFGMIDGVITRVQEHIVDVTSSASAPPSDLIDAHIASIPSVDEDEFINVTEAPYSAVAGTTDSREAIQDAIEDAATAGHNRVLIPYGTFRTGDAVTAGTINLKAHTQLFGISWVASEIRPRDEWMPADSTSPYIITTDSDSEGTASLCSICIDMRATNQTTDNGRFSHVQWRAGRLSKTWGVRYDHDFTNANVENHEWGRTIFTFADHGGGRHYGHWTDGDCNNGTNFKAVKIVGNTQPIAIYGYNCEAAAAFGSSSLAQSAYPLTYMEITDGENIRIYSCKREGQSPTVTITDSTNVGVFSVGGMREGFIGPTLTDTWVTRFNEILGTNHGILFANVVVQTFNEGTSTDEDYTLYEEESDVGAPEDAGILWPQGVAIFKRDYASYDDLLMDFT